jgi:hypothetical protein
VADSDPAMAPSQQTGPLSQADEASHCQWQPAQGCFSCATGSVPQCRTPYSATLLPWAGAPLSLESNQPAMVLETNPPRPRAEPGASSLIKSPDSDGTQRIAVRQLKSHLPFKLKSELAARRPFTARQSVARFRVDCHSSSLRERVALNVLYRILLDLHARTAE